MSISCKDNIIDKAKEIGYLKPEENRYREYCKYIIEHGSDWLLGCSKDEVRAKLDY